MRLGEINQSPLSNLVYRKIEDSIDFLSQLIDPQTGQMPVYGSNDGALVLPLNNCDFTDYRPLLQLGSYVTKKQFLFETGPWDEDVFWLCGERSIARSAKNAQRKIKPGDLRGESFPNGGVYILRGSNSKAVIRCTDFRARPSHADQLHVDLWLRGENIACDAGTYLYSGQGLWRNGLARTSAHNTVVVDGRDQMEMVSRFTWINWSKGKVLRHNDKIWQGEHDGYKPVIHKRTAMVLEDDRWLVVDHLTAAQAHHYALHWLLDDRPYQRQGNSVLLSLDGLKYKVQAGLLAGEGKFSLVRGDPHSTHGWRSRYYGHKEPAISVMLETDRSRACFWTFFGLEDDVVEVEGNSLNVNSNKIPLLE